MMKQTYIMPFDINALLVYHTLKRRRVQVAGFFDNDRAKHGLTYDGIPILPPLPRERDAEVIISNIRLRNILREQLLELNFEKILFPGDVINFNTDAWKDIRHDELKVQFPLLFKRLQVSPFYLSGAKIPHEIVSSPNAGIISEMAISLTNKCTLKCKHCNCLMQYCKAPQDYSFEITEKAFDILYRNVDFISLINVVGGEPFLYPNLAHVMNFLATRRDKIAEVTIITNGTIVPTREVLAAIKNAGAMVYISNYGELSRNKDALAASCSEYGINCLVNTDFEWWEIQQLRDMPSSAHASRKVFQKCVNRCCTLIEGRYFKCSFLATATHLLAVPYDSTNYINVLDPNFSKKTLIDFIESTFAPSGCQYCSGAPADLQLKKIPVAEQTNKPLPYTKYTLGQK